MHPHPTVPAPPSRNDRAELICFGDSITANGAWVASPEASGPWTLINAGRGGRKTSDIATELPIALDANPTAQGLLVLLGVNDLPARDARLDEEKLNACLANLQLALELGLARFARGNIFLGAPCDVDAAGLDAVNAAKGYGIVPSLLARLEIGIERLARGNRINFFSLMRTLRPGQYSDGLHPNADGDARIAEAVGAALTGRAPRILPAFYLVGDSISIDCHPFLTQLCEGHYRYSRKGGLELARADLDRPHGANGGDSSMVLAHLRQVMQAPAAMPDTIVVNCGLHDIKTDASTRTCQIPIGTYRRNLEAMVDLVHGAGKRFVWVTTTPVDEVRHNARSSFHRYEADHAAYHQTAAETMRGLDVPIIDLCSFTAAIGGEIYRDHVHFIPAVCERQAAFLRASLDALLPGH